MTLTTLQFAAPYTIVKIQEWLRLKEVDGETSWPPLEAYSAQPRGTKVQFTRICALYTKAVVMKVTMQLPTPNSLALAERPATGGGKRAAFSALFTVESLHGPKMPRRGRCSTAKKGITRRI